MLYGCLFVYDEAHLRARCREAVEVFGDGVAYATKAFLCVAMARLAHEEGMCLVVATGGELHVALTAGVPPERLVLHGNNKSVEELRRARQVRVGRIVVDSHDELDRLDRLNLEDGCVPKVLVRATPGIEAHTHEFIRTGQLDTVAQGVGPEVHPRRRQPLSTRESRLPQPLRCRCATGRRRRAVVVAVGGAWSASRQLRDRGDDRGDQHRDAAVAGGADQHPDLGRLLVPGRRETALAEEGCPSAGAAVGAIERATEPKARVRAPGPQPASG